MNTAGDLQWLEGLLGSSVMLQGPAARDYGRQWRWLQLVVCVHSVAGARASYGHTCSGEGQGQQQGLGPPAGALVAVAAGSCHGLRITVEAGDKSWTGQGQMHNWRA